MKAQNTISCSLMKTASLLLTAVSLLFGFVYVRFLAIQWDLIDVWGPFFPGPFLMGCILIVLNIGSLLMLVVYFDMCRTVHLVAILPLITNLGTLGLILFYPFTDVWLDRHFRTNRDDFEHIVQMVKAGEIQADDRGYANLPEGYQHLSKGGGAIIIERNGSEMRIFFFTFRGVLDNFSGFIYDSGEQPPSEFGFGGDWKQVDQIAPHWYFAASY